MVSLRRIKHEIVHYTCHLAVPPFSRGLSNRYTVIYVLATSYYICISDFLPSTTKAARAMMIHSALRRAALRGWPSALAVVLKPEISLVVKV